MSTDRHAPCWSPPTATMAILANVNLSTTRTDLETEPFEILVPKEEVAIRRLGFVDDGFSQFAGQQCMLHGSQ